MSTILWKSPVKITNSGSFDFEYPPRLQNDPGLYFFSRKFGDGEYEPFYIGKSVHLRKRLEEYQNSRGKHETRVRNVIMGYYDDFSGVQLRNGDRYFHFGYIQRASGLNIKNTILKAERAFIQYAKIVDWNLINSHHAVDSSFRKFSMSGSRYGYLLPDTLITHK